MVDQATANKEIPIKDLDMQVFHDFDEANNKQNISDSVANISAPYTVFYDKMEVKSERARLDSKLSNG